MALNEVEGLSDKILCYHGYVIFSHHVTQPMPLGSLLLAARKIAPSLSRGTPVVYFLRLCSGITYVGASIDLEQRLADHSSGKACRTTQLDPVVTILRIEVYSTFARARHREAQLKRWSRAKKEALVAGNLVCLHRLSKSRENQPR
jgi:putative endonuclease